MADGAARLRVRPARTGRLLAGLAVVAVAGLGLFAIIARAGQRHDVITIVNDVAAGSEITGDDVAVVAIASDDDLATTAGSHLDAVVGQYARFDLVAGALLAPGSVQPAPLVAADRVLVAVEASAGELPTGLVAGDRVALVLVEAGTCGTSSVGVTDAVVVAVGSRASSADGRFELVSLSVEVPIATTWWPSPAPTRSPWSAPTPTAVPSRRRWRRPGAPAGSSTISTATGTTTVAVSTPAPPATGVVPLDPATVQVTTTTTG